LYHGAAGSIPPLPAAGFANFQACVSCLFFSGLAPFFLSPASASFPARKSFPFSVSGLPPFFLEPAEQQ